jgi:hypothetical protein
VGFCDEQKWRCGRFSPRTSVSLANLHSICISTIIFTLTRGWHNRPGVAAVPIASQTKKKKKNWFGWFIRVAPTLAHRASVKLFLSLQSVRLLGRVIGPSQSRYLTQTQNKHRHPCLECLRASEDSSCLRPRGHSDRGIN